MGQAPSLQQPEPAAAAKAPDGSSNKGDWRSARARDLDKLGGANRAPVRRGESMKKRLEWLQEAVHSQGSAIEEALHKDPFAGRHEIIAQEVRKAINEANLPATKTNGLKLTVKDWQKANHTELRARILQGRKVESETGAVQKVRAESRSGPRSRWGGVPEDELVQTADQAPPVDKSAMRSRARDYYLNMQVAKGKLVQDTYSPKPPPSAPAGDDHGNWRNRVLQAKKTAWRALNTAIAFQGITHNRPKGPARLDSFSFFIANQLGDDLGKFALEADKVATTQQALQDAQDTVQKIHHRPAVPFNLDTSTPAAPMSASAPVTPTQSPYAPRRPTLSKPAQSNAFKPGRGKTLSFSPSKAAAPTSSTSDAPKATAAGQGTDGEQGKGTVGSLSERKSVTLAKAPAEGVNVARSPSIRVKALSGSGRVSMAVRSSTETTEDMLAAARKVMDLESELDQNRKMMTLHVHRANTRWAEHQAWEPAQVTHLTRLAAEASGGQALQFRNAALDALKSGRVAVQVFIGEDVVSLSSAHAAYDLWELDPWFALRMLLPAKAEGVDALSGINLGPRMLLGLAAAVESVAGPDAVSKLHVIIHCSESQEPQVLADLANKHHCGLNPDNVLVVPQRYFHGYLWDATQECFVSARDKLRSLKSFARSSKSSRSRSRRSSCSRSMTGDGGVSVSRSVSRSLSRAASKARRSYMSGSTQLGGSGYAMMQLGWPGEAHVVAKDGTGTPIQGTALEYLASRGVTWMMTRRLRDLTLYDPAATLDLDSLAACLWLHESQGATACVWVDMIASVQAAAAGLQGVVLGHKNHTSDGRMSGSGVAPRPAPSALVGSLMAARHASAPGIIAEAGTDTNGKVLPHGPAPLPVVDLEAASLVSPKLAGLLGEIKARVKGAGLPASTKRYLWRLPELTAALCQPGTLRPVLTVRNTQTFVSFDAAQLTSSSALHCAALCAGPRQTVKNLSSAQDADALLQVIKAQDASGVFRRLLATSTRPRSDGGEPSVFGVSEDVLGDPEALKARDWAGKRVVLLVKDTNATSNALRLALALIRPGRDMLLLVAVASSGLGGEAAARNILAKYLALAKQSAVDCAAEVLPKDGHPLLELIEEYVLDAEADLVVMGSRGQYSGGAQAIGSVAWGLMKAMPCPLLVVKESARLADIEWEKDPVRLMLPVDHTSRGLLRWSAKHLLQPQRRDKIYLAKCGAPPGDGPVSNKAQQEAVNSKRMLDNYADIAFSFHLDNTKRHVEGSYESAGTQWADAEKVHIMAIQAPPGRALQESILKLLSATRSALLLYKGGANDPV